MRNVTFFAVALATAMVCAPASLAAGSRPFSDHASSSGDHAIPRVRSEDSTIAGLIARAYDLSATFRQIVNRINATDGIVYVEPGRCRGMRACMHMKLTIAGPHRILRIVVDRRRATGCDLIASIGHELWHALEVLQETSITSDAALHFFYRTEGRQPLGFAHARGVWETAAAQKAGFNVLTELLNQGKWSVSRCRAQ